MSRDGGIQLSYPKTVKVLTEALLPRCEGNVKLAGELAVAILYPALSESAQKKVPAPRLAARQEKA